MSYRILFLNWQDIKHPLGGGAEVYHQEIFKRIAARGHQVTLLCSGYPGLERTETIDGIRIIRKGGRNYFNYMVPFACRRLLAAEPYDIVVDSINKIPLFSPLYIKKIPVIAVVHHLFKTSIFRETIFPLASYVYMSEKLIRTIYGKTPFIVVSESTRQDLIKSGIREELITIIENCVDHSLYRTTGEPKSAIPLVGFLGRIKRYKSVDHLIKAFAIVKKLMPDAKLVIIGDGEALMGLGTLVLMNKLRLPNLRLVILDNNSYQSTGGQRTCSDAVDFTKICDCEVFKVELADSDVPRIDIPHREIARRFRDEVSGLQ